MLTLAGALILTVVHAPLAWPDWLGWLRPGWVVLVVFFWVMELPHRIGLVSAWIVGLLVDVLYADPLGLNGLVLAATVWCCISHGVGGRMCPTDRSGSSRRSRVDLVDGATRVGQYAAVAVHLYLAAKPESAVSH